MIGTCAMGSDTILRWLAGILDKLRKSLRCGGLQYVLIPRPKESLLDGISERNGKRAAEAEGAVR